MELIKTKTILSSVKNSESWFGVDYNMNLYRGCSHGCIYCDSRSNCYHIENFDSIRGKENALEILEQELKSKRKKGVVGIGAMSDTYNPLEKDYQFTRGALKLLLKYGFGVSIDTKSDLILRDLDLLKEINKHSPVIIKFTITTPYDEISRLIEPRVSPSSKRLEAIKVLSENHIFVGILMTPVLPFLTDKESDIKLLVQKASHYGAKFIFTYMSVTLRENQREYYLEKIDKINPKLKQKYLMYYQNTYDCIPLNYKKLYQLFLEECKKYGLLTKMDEIIKCYQKESVEQISLF